MSLVTACPECATSFHVKQDQLTANRGKVRCGNCGHVFDALSRLGEAPEQTTLTAKPPVLPPASIVNSPRSVPDTASRIKLDNRPRKRRIDRKSTRLNSSHKCAPRM